MSVSYIFYGLDQQKESVKRSRDYLSVCQSRPDEDYLFSLDGTHWLPRLSVLLSTSYAVCSYLRREGAHVLVCYEAGWDRTTQVCTTTHSTHTLFTLTH